MSDGEPPFDDLSRSSIGVDLMDGQRFTAREEDFTGANDEALAIRLAALEEDHRDLDAAITALEVSSPYERLSIARLKKKKLHLKDSIQKIKDQMLPDIIA
ncbi:MAG: hypothetical protein DHS20C05_07430 [Hyphococcus sp.]|nr:MAG: hypothetical protein DHS20C05_07430 [Marinicaulis sp.]